MPLLRGLGSLHHEEVETHRGWQDEVVRKIRSALPGGFVLGVAGRLVDDGWLVNGGRLMVSLTGGWLL